MKLSRNPLSILKHKNLIVKVFVSFLILGLAYRLSISRSITFSQVSTTDFPDETDVTNPIDSVNVAEITNQMSPKEKCDLFTGDWIPNPSGPAYTNESCPLIGDHMNCMKNGRPDSGYRYWRWKPQDCELPRFDAEKFLEFMRNKQLALIGDSISQNHVLSLLCMLSKVEIAILVYHDDEYKSKRWNFPSYNFSISAIWSPFLTKASIFEDINGVTSSDAEINLDKLDKEWTDLYQSLDYMIISSGKWFTKNTIYYENDAQIGCYNCTRANVTDFGFDFGYRKVLKLVLDYISTSNHKGLIYFRTSTPDHFENGEWSTGGTCPRTEPVKGKAKLKRINRILHGVELEEFEKASKKASENGVNFKLLDFNSLLLLRPDGHPGPYRHFYPFAKDKDAKVQNDCLHWCLPGPIDSWNDVIMEMFINS